MNNLPRDAAEQFFGLESRNPQPVDRKCSAVMVHYRATVRVCKSKQLQSNLPRQTATVCHCTIITTLLPQKLGHSRSERAILRACAYFLSHQMIVHDIGIGFLYICPSVSCWYYVSYLSYICAKPHVKLLSTFLCHFNDNIQCLALHQTLVYNYMLVISTQSNRVIYSNFDGEKLRFIIDAFKHPTVYLFWVQEILTIFR